MKLGKINYAAKGGLIGLVVLLVISVMIRIGIISNEVIISILYFPVSIGFYFYTGLISTMAYLSGGMRGMLGIFIMFSFLVLFYYLAGVFVGYFYGKNKKMRKRK